MTTANAWFLALTVAGIGALVMAATAATNADYNIHYAVSADNAAPAIQALSHGDLAVAFAHQPAMGLLSLIIRAPFAWLAEVMGGGQMLVYRLGVFACLAPVAVLAAWVAVSVRARGAILAGVIAGGLLLVGSPDAAAIGWGHPEELLAATLAVTALLAADRGHPALAGALAGAAIGTKAWAVIAVLPMVLALDRHRFKALAWTAGVGALLAGVPPLADPAAFARASHALGSSHIATMLSGWWLVSGPAHAIQAPVPLGRTLPFAMTKTFALALGVGAAVALALALTWRALRDGGRLGRRGRKVDALALLGMFAVVRCVADPGPVEYYYAAALVPIAVWEVVTLGRLPIVALALVAVVRLEFGSSAQLGPDLESAIALCFGLAAATYLAVQAFLIGRPQTAGPNPTGGR